MQKNYPLTPKRITHFVESGIHMKIETVKIKAAAGKYLPIIKRYWIFYLIGSVIALVLKIFFSTADAGALDWILAPTALWVKTLSGIPFIRQGSAGYVSHDFQVMIAPSCSGVQFMMISFITLLFSYVHRMRTVKRGVCWLALSMGCSYLFTVFVNGFRIILAIPLLKLNSGGWMTPDRIHMLEGTAVYFVSLMILHQTAGAVLRKIAGLPKKHSNRILPVLCYLGITLGIPLVNRLYKNNNENFAEYALLLTAACLTICLIYGIIRYILMRFAERKGFGLGIRD